MQRAIDSLLRERQEEFTDKPKKLKEDPQRIIPWIRLMMASNLVDYSKASLIDEIEREGNLAQYILNRMDPPGLQELGRDRHLNEFVGRIRDWNIALVHLPDNNAELAASLNLAEVLLSANPTMQISMILKQDNNVLNDASVADAERLMAKRKGMPDVYRKLRRYHSLGWFSLVEGPAMLGTPLHLLPQPAVQALREADLVLAEGEANVWSLNGLNKEIYFGLRLKWLEGIRYVFGLELTDEQRAQRPPAFFRIDGTQGPYYRNPFSATDRLTIAQTLHRQSTGLEEVGWFDAEAFLTRYPDQAPRLPHGTGGVGVIPVGATVTLYRPGTLAGGLEEVVRTQQAQLPGLAIDRKSIPASAVEVRWLAVIVWDPMLGRLPYLPPVPVVEHQLGQPFPYSLLQLVALAALGRPDLDPARVAVLAAWELEQDGRRFLAIAVGV
jgi:uncharacterized protein with ATP-grasp and redox domains